MVRFLTGADSMRITRKKYARARDVVDDAREQMKLIKQWDEAIKQVEHPDRVDAITVNDDGSIRFELLHAAKSRASLDRMVQS